MSQLNIHYLARDILIYSISSESIDSILKKIIPTFEIVKYIKPIYNFTAGC